ncbi:MAG: Crp/Fnr family transcriptional regulator [Alphaproteobacteria bacterium]|nr:Crp/Fnr family transcriptional regulator [Alphaproteobacteria bacterium]MCB9975151.1 Crp/Fnr family transcriptional regulator [Rhodospirillales bacterium]
MEGYSIERHNKGYIAFIYGEDAHRYYIIRRGWVKLYRETLDGSQAIIDILPRGHIFGETAVFEHNTYPYSAEIIEPVDMISLSLKKLNILIQDRPDFALSMLKSMARYRKQQDLEIEHRSLQNAPQRIGCFILRLTPAHTDPNLRVKAVPVTINLPYDKTLIAARLGMQPETFSRALTKLKEHTNITVKGATIEIHDLEALIAYACSACTSDFPCQDLNCSSCCN